MLRLGLLLASAAALFASQVDAATCGNQVYDPAQYTCTNGMLCPSGNVACGTTAGFACYKTSQYCCVNNSLQQAGSAACSGTNPNPTPTPTPTPHPGGSRNMEIVNNCKQTIWPGIYGLPQPGGTPLDGGWEQAPGSRVNFQLPEGWYSGRIWARTGCTGTSGSSFHCETGDCGNEVGCHQRTGIPNVLLAEWSFVADGDFMDVSGVDAYNVGISIEPINGTPVNANDYYLKCTKITCSMDINTCPDAFKVRGASGQVVACNNNADKGQPQQLWFKQHCPDAYSWPYDDPTSTFRCKGANYRVTFCP
ncbi:hypothetical protein HK101_004127 [Irineochytrium annulatum]|nr:hypothetical protein HK101_004127 [Irineochytrium annulatum]